MELILQVLTLILVRCSISVMLSGCVDMHLKCSTVVHNDIMRLTGLAVFVHEVTKQHVFSLSMLAGQFPVSLMSAHTLEVFIG